LPYCEANIARLALFAQQTGGGGAAAPSAPPPGTPMQITRILSLRDGVYLGVHNAQPSPAQQHKTCDAIRKGIFSGMVVEGIFRLQI
jgi:hypothetical protein